jgi:hypothetical protein
MRHLSPAFALFALAALLAMAPRLAVRPSPAAAQPAFTAGLSVTVKAERTSINPGEAIQLAVALTNAGTSPVTVLLGCAPAHDLQVRDGQGNLMWRLNPTCNPAGSSLNLAPGQTQEWTGLWPGITANGTPIPAGVYGVWGIVETVPLSSIAGPVVISVGGAVATSTLSAPPTRTRTATPRPDEPTRTPTRVEEPTRTPTRRIEEPTRTGTTTPRPDEPTRTPTRRIEEPTRTATPPGGAVSGPRFGVVERPGNQRQPDVAGDPEREECQNLVVWWDEHAGEIWGRFVERHELGEPFLISGDAGADGPPAVAYNARRQLWLVVWSDMVEGGNSDVRARFVSCEGVEEHVFTVPTDPATADQPAVAAFDETFGIVWRQGEGGRARIMGGQVVELSVHQIVPIGPVGEVSEPAVACEPNEPCLVAWTRAEGDALDVVGRYWFPHEEYAGERHLTIATSPRRERYPSIAWNDADGIECYVVTWTDEGGERATVRARSVYPAAPRTLDDYVLGDPALIVSEDGHNSDHGDVARLGRGFVVVWASGADAVQDIWGRRVSVSGTARLLANGSLVPVSDSPMIERYPAVSSSGDPLALAVWEAERDNHDIDIFGRHVAATAPGAAGTLVTLLGQLRRHTPVADGGVWTVSVNSVLSGHFPCAEARVYYDQDAQIDPSLQPGDHVLVRGRIVPEQGACALQADVEGILGLTRAVIQLLLPLVLRQ